MSYYKSSKRLTIPLETSEQIKDAARVLQTLSKSFEKLYKSPNTARNKCSMAQFEVQFYNSELKALGNGSKNAFENSSYYKRST